MTDKLQRTRCVDAARMQKWVAAIFSDIQKKKKSFTMHFSQLVKFNMELVFSSVLNLSTQSKVANKIVLIPC